MKKGLSGKPRRWLRSRKKFAVSPFRNTPPPRRSPVVVEWKVKFREPVAPGVVEERGGMDVMLMEK